MGKFYPTTVTPITQNLLFFENPLLAAVIHFPTAHATDHCPPQLSSWNFQGLACLPFVSEVVEVAEVRACERLGAHFPKNHSRPLRKTLNSTRLNHFGVGHKIPVSWTFIL